MALNTSSIKTIFFDYDGTLHDTRTIYIPSFKRVYEDLVDRGYAEERDFKDEEISKWIGYNPREMWKTFMPNLPEEVRDQSSKKVGLEMSRLIREGRASLYQGALETLDYLKGRGYKLVFLSNCSEIYMKSHREIFNLDRYFISMINAQEYNYIEKHEILSLIKDQYEGEMAIVGDREKDIISGKKNNIYTIACKYGFGKYEEIKEADLIIENIKELRGIF